MPSIQHLQKGISASMRVTNNRKSLFIKPDKKVTCSHESIIVRATFAYLDQQEEAGHRKLIWMGVVSSAQR